MHELLKEYETPVYFYDEKKIKDSVERLRIILSNNMKIFYSVKANPNIHIIEKLKEYVDGMEVCSAGEIFLALKAGVLPENLIFVGPGKTIKELNFAISNNVGFVVIESLREAEQIEQIAEKQGKIVNTLIRVNPSNCALNAAIKMGGSAKQFGIDEEMLLKE